MSVASPSMASPRPSSPGRHRARPSFAIGYSQPSPLRMSTSSDPKSPTGPSSTPTKPSPSSSSSSNPTAAVSSNPNPVVNLPSKHFVVPAHPQSHHLHTLPPREKTTRTLILDHTAWRQGRTRLAQGRYELGMNIRFRSEERAAEGAEVAGGRGAFYIGSASASGSIRVSDFGDPPEVELASSDEEGEDVGAKESDGEGVRALMYGSHFKQVHRKRKQDAKAHDRMEVDTEHESNSGSDSDEEPSPRRSSAGPQDPSLALSLAARATGIEKVLRAMLSQPPSTPPRSPSPPPYALHSSHANSQHYRPPPSLHPSPQPNDDPQPVLPNGLRLRLALLALVNDLFERQPPPPEQQVSSASDDGSTSRPVATTSANPGDTSKPPSEQNIVSPPPLPPPSLPPPNGLPSELALLAQISCQPFYAAPSLPSFHTLALPSSSSGPSVMSSLSPISGTNTTQTASPSSAQPINRAATGVGKEAIENRQSPAPPAPRPPPPLFSWTRPSASPAGPSSFLPSSPRAPTLPGPSRDRGPERAPATAPTPQPLPRYPSSWKRGTQKHQPDKAAAISMPTPGLAKRARGRSKELYLAGCHAKPPTTMSASSFRSNVPVYSYGTAPPPPPTTPPGYPLKKLKSLCPRHLRERCKICTASVATHGRPYTKIGAGLLKKRGDLLSGAPPPEERSGSVLADLIPRFLRLSALVAMELGREARGEEPEAEYAQEDHDKPDVPDAPPDSPLGAASRFSSHAQPTRAWFAILCSLLTRAVLEGYVARDWKGAEYAEVLLGVGLGIKGIGTRRNSAISGTSVFAPEIPTVEDHVDELEPDEMPPLVDAGKMLFSGLLQDLTTPGSKDKDKATRSVEEEYVMEMEERLSEFLTIPLATPDLATHLTQLSEKYPAEPVERAALRFCEAVAKWRGKPELEMHKRPPVRPSTKSETSTPLPLSIDAILASTPTPTPQRPPIDKYFRVPPRSSGRLLPQPLPQPPRVLKRQRSVDELERETKKEKIEVPEDDLDQVEDEEAMQGDGTEWVGPYGV
ncbi:hypothetical protein JB92DRAFT_2976684 [Gautieria morchelliformis]|nr:hypothetical protein JB92DRAFT_2976684 [Gautieria morchelliformis]